MPAGFAAPKLVDQAWLLVPRASLIGALLRLDARLALMDALEKILVTLDDSAHLLADDTADDAMALFAEQGRELEAIAEQSSESASSTSTTTPAAAKKPKRPQAAVVHRNPVTAASNFPQWRTAVEEGLARILHVERVTLGGSFGKTFAPGQALSYEIEATVRPRATVEGFYAELAPALVLARFIVEDGIDTRNEERMPALGMDDLLGYFESQEVRAARRTLNDRQFELAKMLVAAEVARRVYWRPNMEGTALSGGGHAGIAAAYQNNDDASFTINVFNALTAAVNGNKKRSAKTIITEWLAAHKDAQASTINGRMARRVTGFLESTKQIRFSDVERYVPLYDAIQLLFKASFNIGVEAPIIRNDQLHPLVDVLAAPLTGHYYMRFRTEPFPAGSLTSSRTLLDAVYAPRYEWAYSLETARRALASINISNVVAVHEFVFATPAAPPPPPTVVEGAQSATTTTPANKTQGHNYIQVNVIEAPNAGAPVTLRDVLGDNYSPLTLAGNDRFRALLLLTGMPISHE